MQLSIVIPAYNEAKTFRRTLRRLEAFAKELPFSHEVIIVDDGSTDDTVAVVKRFQQRWPALKLIQNPRNRGKGYSVRAGVLAAQGDEILFTDADLSTPLGEYFELKPFLRYPLSLVIASRDLGTSRVERPQAWYREAMGKTFNKIVRFLTGLPYHDTQCGFKLFTREAAGKIFPKLRVSRFAFDVEILWLARKFGISIQEVPVRWINHPISKVRIVRDSLRMLWDIFKMHFWNSRGLYS